SPDGTLWFGTDGGVVTLDLLGSMPNSTAPPVLIEEIAVNGKPWPQLCLTLPSGAAKSADDPVRLPSALRSLDIQFTALDLSASDKIRFRHRLDGSDPDWVVDGEATRNVHYGRLPYGVYTFRVQAGDAERRWFNNRAAFHFLIPTPLWRAPWA